jgi:uncharacterized protein YjiK
MAHTQSSGIGYDFDQPELLANLPKALNEISGLSLSPQSGEILAVEDENGKFYRLSLSTGRVLGSTTFWKDGDYEGLEAVGDDIWVVKSTGTLYRIRRPGLASQEVTKFNGFLEEENNVEGLTYDPATNRLLLVCKAHAAGFLEVRSVFAFDLSTETLLKTPVYSVGRLGMRAFLAGCPQAKKHQKLVAFINERKNYELAPSAIAIHPKTGQVFITSSVGKILVVLGQDGKIQHVRKLDKDYFAQPEGLVFTSDGTLYISTEAKDGEPARIYRLPYKPGFEGM